MNTEVVAVSYLKEVLATTDFLSPFINEGDKEPSWDGNIYLHSGKNHQKAGIKRIPVQVKGIKKQNHPNTISFLMGKDDMDNYLRHGGIILFVVYISPNGKKKTIYYSSLLPMKIRVLISNHEGKEKIPVECESFPNEADGMVSICANFHENMLKQTSFATVTLPKLEDLEKAGLLESISMSTVAVGNQKNDLVEALLQETPYIYAKIKGSPALMPLEMIPQALHVSEDVSCSIAVGGKIYYQNARRIRSKGMIEFCFGKSFKICKIGEKNQFNFTPAKMLPDSLIDTEFLIGLIENGTLFLNEEPLHFEGIQNAWGEKLVILKEQLEYCRKVKAILEKMGVNPWIDVTATSEADVLNTDRLYKGLVRGEIVDNLYKGLPAVFTIDYYSQKLLLGFIASERPGAYSIYDFKDVPLLFSYSESTSNSKQIPTSRYEMLKADDYLEIANIDLADVVSSYQEIISNENIYNEANYTVLKLLEAFDKSCDERKDLLECALRLAEWLASLTIDESVLSKEIRQINLWQIFKRMGTLCPDAIRAAFKLAENPDQSEVIKVGAYLIIGDQSAAKYHFDRLQEEEKGLIERFPIYRFWEDPGKSSALPI